MKKSSKLVLSGAIGLLLFIVLPGAYKILSFLICAIAISMAFTVDGRISIPILVALSALYLLFPSSFFTLDVTLSYDTSFFVASSITTWTNAIIGVFIIGIPTLILVGSIYAFISGNVDGGVSGIIKLLLVVVLILVASTVLGFFGITVPGFESLTSFGQTIWRVISSISDFFAAAINTLDVFNVIEEIPTISDSGVTLVLDAVGSPRSFSLIVFSSFPMISAFLCFLIGLIFQFKADNVNKLIKKHSEKDDIVYNTPGSSSMTFIVYWVIETIIVLALYISRDLEQLLSRTGVLFIIYYVVISVTLLLLTLGFNSYSKTNKQTIYGVIYGVAGLFAFFNMFQQVRTLDILATEYSTLTSSVVLTQFLFVAPMESLLFHVFLPGLVMYFILLQNKRYSADGIDLQIARKNEEIRDKEILLDFYGKTDRITRDQEAKLKSIIEQKRKLNTQLAALQETKNRGIRVENKVTGTQLTVYFCLVIVFQIIFASFHYLNSSMDYGTFWISGLGLIYLSSGVWLAYIGYRYGWASAIFVHALNNTLGLLLIGVI